VDAREIVVDVAAPEEYSQLAMSSASSLHRSGMLLVEYFSKFSSSNCAGDIVVLSAGSPEPKACS
jgi:hypothetical protein